MKNFKNLNVYLADLAVINVKLHNLHWNVQGRNFYQVHTFTEGLYDTFFEWFDEIAEVIKMKGDMPLSTLKDYLSVATLKEEAPRAFSVDEVNEMVMNDLISLKENAIKLRAEADEDGDFHVVSVLEDHVKELEKNIWFLRASKCCNK